jgi:Glyoxalase/Bleomycin resistance protein/Dioxygenase superfamily
MSRASHPLYSQEWPGGEYRFFQVGFVVNDLVQAANRWAAVHGVGPFHLIPVVEQQLVVQGQPAPVSIQVGIAQAGPVQIELIQQHCNRPSIYRHWSQDGHRPFHQLATLTPDYDAKKKEFESHGYQLAAESPNGTFRVGYFDTLADFGFYTEVVERTEDLLKRWDSVSRTCASWDGTDPVRLMTRDGYRVP